MLLLRIVGCVAETVSVTVSGIVPVTVFVTGKIVLVRIAISARVYEFVAMNNELFVDPRTARVLDLAGLGCERAFDRL